VGLRNIAGRVALGTGRVGGGDERGDDHDRSAQIDVRADESEFESRAMERGWRPAVGYFFTDTDRRKLQSLADHLTQHGYQFVDIHPADDHSRFVLHVEKVEHHTAESLNERNLEFYELADRFDLASYDGMGVGPIE
jgi:hypothetical protein